ncbi:hypothetical protein ASC94_30700 [Massilia sp. Root418]|uniref:hypothetical protein n=1 Tax=Massilia sp. Root418 TaxID=1736532 RepID=UPI0006F76C02|nr:hypothetical protein [Massilia sp. Root418]KQW99910.1 hypothetical protein ASC94_30700 [Massilia sp. Root418]
MDTDFATAAAGAMPLAALLATPCAVVAHDAGAANHILAWLRGSDAAALLPSMAGPALQAWRRERGDTPQLGLEQAVAGAQTVLTGTGWASDLEHAARRLARQQGKHSIAVLDHWTNYRERFERGGEQVLPDELWVSDRHALALARRLFPAIPVRQQPNAYLDGLVAEVHACERAATAALASAAATAAQQAGTAPQPARVLYVLEPIRQAWGELSEPGEFAALDFFIAGLDRLQLGPQVDIRLRPHPSDPPGKYDAWLARQNAIPPEGVTLALDSAATLAQALAWSQAVAGCQTYAMVVALAAGRRVVSSVPPWAPRCVLPHPDIIQLSDLYPTDPS